MEDERINLTASEYAGEAAYAQQGQMMDIPTKQVGHITLRRRYELELQHHHAEIQRLQKLLQLLDENPAIEQFMNLSRGRY